MAATKEQYVGEDKRQLAPSAVDNEKLKERGKLEHLWSRGSEHQNGSYKGRGSNS